MMIGRFCWPLMAVYILYLKIAGYNNLNWQLISLHSDFVQLSLISLIDFLKIILRVKW